VAGGAEEFGFVVAVVKHAVTAVGIGKGGTFVMGVVYKVLP